MTIATATRPRREAPLTDGIRREALRGRAAGVMVGAVFGLAWVASALTKLPSVASIPVMAASVAIFAVLMTGARRLRRAAANTAASTPLGAGRRNVRRRFAVVVAGEWVAIIAAVNILAGSGDSQWLPAVICAAIGLHFVPLARLFHVRLYYATAVALLLVATTTMTIGSTGAPASLWQVLPGFGAAVALWATSIGLLVTAGQ